VTGSYVSNVKNQSVRHVSNNASASKEKYVDCIGVLIMQSRTHITAWLKTNITQSVLNCAHCMFAGVVHADSSAAIGSLASIGTIVALVLNLRAESVVIDVSISTSVVQSSVQTVTDERKMGTVIGCAIHVVGKHS